MFGKKIGGFMDRNFIYYTLLLFIIFITINNLIESYKYSPKKLKSIINIVLLLMLFKGISLFMLSFVESQRQLFLLKYTVFLEFMYIPIMALLSLYIFLRRDKGSFRRVKIIALVLFVFYIGTLGVLKPIFDLSLNYGYLITFKEEFFIRLIYLILLCFLLSLIILLKKEKHSNKSGLFFLGGVLAFIIVENSLSLLGIGILNGYILSDLLCGFLFFYVIETFKKNRIFLG